MQSKSFNTAVVMLWLATMSWLMKEKVLPPFFVGEPPNYSGIIDAQRSAPRVSWRIFCSGRPVGWAFSDTRTQSAEVTEIRSRVHFDTLPLKELMPAWLQVFSPLTQQSVDGSQMDARSTLAIDPLGHLVRFDSKVRLYPLGETIELSGAVEGQQLQVVASRGRRDVVHRSLSPLRRVVVDAFSPQTQLPGLRAGQTWTVPVFSPLSFGKSSLEIVRRHGRTPGADLVEWRDHGLPGGGVSQRYGKLRQRPGITRHALGWPGRHGPEAADFPLQYEHPVRSSH